MLVQDVDVLLGKLAFTIYTENFADDHFLFHLFLVPFTFGNLIIGAKVSASLITISIFLFFFWTVQRHWFKQDPKKIGSQ